MRVSPLFALTFCFALVSCATPRSALLERFEAGLAAQDSATAALESWCGQRGFADPARVIAAPLTGEALAASARIRAQLGVTAAEPLKYRHVRLSCGGRALSDAHNWYVPARLTAEMNRQLETSDIPFGKVIASLDFTRERLAAQRGASPECPPGTVLSHRALLRLPDGRAISLVIECYGKANLH